MTFKIELQTVNGEPAGAFATNLSVGSRRGVPRKENELMRIVAMNDEGGVWRLELVESRPVPISD